MGEASYYDRTAATHIDGTPIFRSTQDEANEREVARALAQAWRCEIRSFGCLSPVDWYALRDERMVGVLELKSRAHPSDRYPTVFLNLRKWLALTLASVGHGTPAVFVVRFEDGVRWVPLSDIDARKVRMGGCSRMVKARSDQEPVIEVEVSIMRPLTKGEGGV